MIFTCLRIYTLTLCVISSWAAYFEDPKFSLEVMEKLCSIEAKNVLIFWTPRMRDVRQLPR
ncbi:MAG: hypothetical protein ACFFCW_36600, partial [Candidatus Hodarchaeota archaeon]